MVASGHAHSRSDTNLIKTKLDTLGKLSGVKGRVASESVIASIGCRGGFPGRYFSLLRPSVISTYPTKSLLHVACGKRTACPDKDFGNLVS